MRVVGTGLIAQVHWFCRCSPPQSSLILPLMRGFPVAVFAHEFGHFVARAVRRCPPPSPPLSPTTIPSTTDYSALGPGVCPPSLLPSPFPLLFSTLQRFDLCEKQGHFIRWKLLRLPSDSSLSGGNPLRGSSPPSQSTQTPFFIAMPNHAIVTQLGFVCDFIVWAQRKRSEGIAPSHPAVPSPFSQIPSCVVCPLSGPPL